MENGNAAKRSGVAGIPALRLGALLLLYVAVLLLALWTAYALRFDFDIPAIWSNQFRLIWPVVLPIKLMMLMVFGQFSGLLSFFSVPDLKRLFLANASAALVFLLMRYFSESHFWMPRGVVLIDFLMSMVGLAMLRLAFRVYREKYVSSKHNHSQRSKRVAIIGAGSVGASLARELFAKKGLGLQPVVFFDDDPTKWRLRVHEIPVIGAPEILLQNDLNLRLDEAIIALPTAPPKRIGEIIKVLQKAHLKFETVPSVDQLATGRVKVSQLRNVEIQDLLGRDPVELETANIAEILKGKVVMVTGAGGSIGSELCRQIASFTPQRLLLVEQSEVQIFQIEQELIEKGYSGIVLPLVADITDEQRMRYIFGRFNPSIVFHAAAHKHVPMMESQPGEAIKNNTFGTALVAKLALEFKADRFVLISTDKAINPTNVMGATKRLAEIFIQALANANQGQTKFMAVRFGNVLGSSGSVIPIFKAQIAAGGPIKVTHPDVTRYFMTIPEASGLVLQSASQGSGGEIFVLDMGAPVKIVDLARQLIELSGLKPDEDIEIEFVGLRPGEKLFEELSHEGENITPTNHPKIMRFVTEPLQLQTVVGMLDELKTELNHAEPDHFKKLLKNAVPEYKPYLS
ncbi:MAG: polysaccharide biosynthesis protein [Verrucomicrobiales bacterium]